jgi:hypothetical protein
MLHWFRGLFGQAGRVPVEFAEGRVRLRLPSGWRRSPFPVDDVDRIVEVYKPASGFARLQMEYFHFTAPSGWFDEYADLLPEPGMYQGPMIPELTPRGFDLHVYEGLPGPDRLRAWVAVRHDREAAHVQAVLLELHHHEVIRRRIRRDLRVLEEEIRMICIDPGDHPTGHSYGLP